MPHLYKKKAKGRTYWYLRETQREGRRVTVKWQKYLGTPETILKRLEAAEETSAPLKLSSEEFGSVFVANELEKRIGTIDIVDSIVPKSPREKGPSVGEYFFYAWANRLIQPKSKNAIGKWYSRTAIDTLRPVKTSELNSARYWAKWDRVSKEQVEQIGKAFFERIWELREKSPEHVLFDTTNFYSYIDSKTESELFARGHNKASKHHLRQVGVALMVDRASRLPMFYREYSGNEHDSKVFQHVIDEMFGVLCGFNTTKERLTVVFDKGMNSEDNAAFIDEHRRVHFVTTYSTYFADELTSTDLKHFAPVSLRTKNNKEESVLAYRTQMELWGKQRTVIVTYNPRTQRKKMIRLERKLERLRESLLVFRRNFREQKPHWRKFDTIEHRYSRLCEELRVGTQYYRLEQTDDGSDLSFRKDAYQVKKAEDLFGRNIIVTDNSDWTTDDIVQANLDRWMVEKQFRDAKSTQHGGFNPIFHWTDSKVRCHLLACIISLTMKRFLELAVEPTMGVVSAETILDEMRSLNSVVVWMPGKKKPTRQIEVPTKTQNVVLNALGYRLDDSWVLQPVVT